jgi:predicted ATP-dependent endonuclease of OLD family
MKIKKIKISNFRGLQNIEFKPNSNTSVIVGPNAVGKTTILEVIRLTKSLLMPSYIGEEQEVFNSIGGKSPQNNKIKLEYILGDIIKL